MSVSTSIRWLGAFLKDKVLEATFFFTKSNELKSYNTRKEYSERFLNDFNHQEKIRQIWNSLLDEQLPINKKEICKIYRVNFTYFFEWSLNKLNYFIENRFWSSLDYFEIDTLQWEDKDIFENASLVTYVITKTNKSCLIILTSLNKQKYTLLKTYEIKALPIEKFKKRQLVYCSEKGFLSI